jgi:hypothetical protein
MHIYCWNIRGLNSPLKQHEVANLMKKNGIDVCCFLETKFALSKLQFMHRFRLKNWKFRSNLDVARYARIVVFWNPATVVIELLAVSEQGLHVSIRCLVSHLEFVATFVYGLNTITARRGLWNDLRQWLLQCLGLSWVTSTPFSLSRTSIMVNLSCCLIWSYYGLFCFEHGTCCWVQRLMMR